MQRVQAAAVNGISRRVRGERRDRAVCDVFINHRGVDTKRNVAGLLYDSLRRTGLRPFLDRKSMKPGDRLFEKIEQAVRECKIGVAVFSPEYCDSYFCLHELSLMMQWKKKVVPIFCDVKPSDILHLPATKNDWPSSDSELNKFRHALWEAKNTVGLTFDSSNGDWSEFLSCATDAIIRNVIEVEDERRRSKSNQSSSSVFLPPSKRVLSRTSSLTAKCMY